MQGTYNYRPETNHVSSVYNVATFSGYNLYTSNALFHDKRFVLLCYCFSKYVRSAQYGCFL